MLWRAVSQVVVIPVATVVLGLMVIIVCPFDRTGRAFPMLGRAWCRALCLAAGIRIEAEDLGRLHDGPVVLVSNHASLFDPPILMLALPRVFRFIAKRSLFRVPLFGQAIRAAGMIPIDRGDRARAVASMNRAAAQVAKGASVLIFAEGTRSRDGRLGRLKKGAFVLAIQAGVPVQPVAIRGSRQVLPHGALLARPGTVHVSILDPVPTAEMTYEDRDDLRDRVSSSLISALEETRSGRRPHGADAVRI
ncbi:MAG: lysophospholipid acyltransferase family protein [Acidobacteriota bacterium]